MRALCLLLLVVAVSAAEDAASTTEPAKTAHHVARGLTITVPADWRAAPPTGAALALESPHVADDAALRAAGRVAVTVASTALSDATAAADAVADDLRRTAIGFEIRDQADVVVDGRTWHRLHLRFRTGQLGWEQQLYSAVDRSRVVYVCLSTDLAHFAERSAEFERIAASLRWDPTTPLDD